MNTMSRLFVLSAVVLAGCATQQASGPGGKYLVYRDNSGQVMRQFDYPSDDFCRRVEAVAGRAARCQPESVSANMTAQATLRYNPPGVLVHAYYPDMGRCQSETGQLGPGVELINACSGNK